MLIYKLNIIATREGPSLDHIILGSLDCQSIDMGSPAAPLAASSAMALGTRAASWYGQRYKQPKHSGVFPFRGLCTNGMSLDEVGS